MSKIDREFEQCRRSRGGLLLHEQSGIIESAIKKGPLTKPVLREWEK